ncbi:putative bifunctional diguanylate cyclase/phosphodiesterase, partial [Cellulomonas endophytica]|uniref:putative bifunctional diguanylate cyclase/phosphodiesterase n=1 Tax=Cellulomonas endophytica TaxID=2494735 RepID=UPI00196A2120
GPARAVAPPATAAGAGRARGAGRGPALSVAAATSVATPRVMARTAGALWSSAGAIGFVGVGDAAAFSGRSTILVMAALALAAGVVIGLRAHTWPRGSFHVIAAGGAVVITAGTALAASAPIGGAIAGLYLFVVLDAFLFFPWRTAAAHLAATAALHALVAAATGQSVVLALLMQVTFAAAGALVGWLVRAAAEATVDPVTGLMNRAGLDRVLAEHLRGSEAPSSAVVLLDLDGFRGLNEGAGVEAGDHLLRTVAQRTARAAGPSATVARSGSDEFAVLLPGLDEDAAVRVADALRAALPTSASAGVAVPVRGDSPASLVHRAKGATYEALERGGARTVVAAEADGGGARLRAALRAGELAVHFQPVVLPGDGTVVSAEALVRWFDPVRGTVPPDCFVPVAERDGSVVELGRWVLVRAVQQLADWRGRAGLPQSVAVNVSHRELCDPAWAGATLALLRAAGLPPQALVVEVTETTLGRDEDSVRANLVAVRDAGVEVSVDDFGTGWSSLSRLEELPVTQLKVDRSFVARLGDGVTATPVLEAIVQLARGLGLTVVAEGVETAEQARAVADLGCTLAQGWHFGRPVPAAHLGAPPTA